MFFFVFVLLKIYCCHSKISKFLKANMLKQSLRVTDSVPHKLLLTNWLDDCWLTMWGFTDWYTDWKIWRWLFNWAFFSVDDHQIFSKPTRFKNQTLREIPYFYSLEGCFLNQMIITHYFYTYTVKETEDHWLTPLKKNTVYWLSKLYVLIV